MTSLAPGGRCAAAHPEDRSACEGSREAVKVIDQTGAAAVGCVHHAARLYASLDRPRVYPMPGHDKAALEVYHRASTMAPFAWRHVNQNGGAT